MIHKHLTDEQFFEKFESAVNHVYDAYVTAPFEVDGYFIQSRDTEVHGLEVVTGSIIDGWLIATAQEKGVLYTTRLPL